MADMAFECKQNTVRGENRNRESLIEDEALVEASPTPGGLYC